jgi:uncharacterized protein (DUF2062 family)
MNWLKQQLAKRLLSPLRAQLLQGTSPSKLALSCALGVAIGAFPLLGTTTLLCVLVGSALKLNQPALQAVNWVMAPVQLATIPLFVSWGAKLTGGPDISLTPHQIATEFLAGFWSFMAKFGWIGVHAIMAWALVMPWIAAAVYFICRRIFARWRRQQT